jgi:hypothetical protein
MPALGRLAMTLGAILLVSGIVGKSGRVLTGIRRRGLRHNESGERGEYKNNKD